MNNASSFNEYSFLKFLPFVQTGILIHFLDLEYETFNYLMLFENATWLDVKLWCKFPSSLMLIVEEATLKHLSIKLWSFVAFINNTQIKYSLMH